MSSSAFMVARPTGAALRALNYTPEVERLRSRQGGQSLGSMLADLGPAYGAVFTRVDCEASHGIELVTQGDMFAAEPTGRIIRRDSMARPERHEIRRWQVLIAGAGTLGENELYGRPIIADSRLVGRYVGPHAMVLTFKEPESDSSLFAYAFLLSRIGLRAIRAASFGTKILGLRKDLLRELPIPDVVDELRLRVATLIRRCVFGRETYLKELSRARQIIEGLPAMQEAQAMCAERTRRATIWDGAITTLSAWNFASTGGALGHLQCRWSGRLREIGLPNGVFNGPRFARVDCQPPHGVEFFSQRDVFLMRPVPRRIARPSVPDRLFFVSRDAVIAGSHGQLTDGGLFGKVELASFAAHNGGLTQDLLRLLFRPEQRAVAYTFLSTLVGQRLMKSTAVGTSIPSMRLDLLEELPFPDVTDKQRAEVGAHLAKAESARCDAAAAEAEAVHIVESEVLPAWLA